MNVKEWCKKNIPWLVSGISVVIAFIVGRRNGIERASIDIQRIREYNEHLEIELCNLGIEVERLRELNRIDAERYATLENKLSEQRALIRQSRIEVDNGRTSVEELDNNNKLFAEWIAKYGEDLKLL